MQNNDSIAFPGPPFPPFAFLILQPPPLTQKQFYHCPLAKPVWLSWFSSASASATRTRCSRTPRDLRGSHCSTKTSITSECIFSGHYQTTLIFKTNGYIMDQGKYVGAPLPPIPPPVGDPCTTNGSSSTATTG